MDHDVLGLELAGRAYDRAAPVDRGTTVILHDSEQLARVAHAEDVANRGRRWHVVIHVEAVHGVSDRAHQQTTRLEVLERAAEERLPAR
jgi:hypothetical protein